MKNIFLIIVVLTLASCEAMISSYCPEPMAEKQRQADSMYNTFGTLLARDIDEKKAKKIFGCNYERGDDIYIYPTLWSKKYVLVRNGTGVTYAEDKK